MRGPDSARATLLLALLALPDESTLIGIEGHRRGRCLRFVANYPKAQAFLTRCFHAHIAERLIDSGPPEHETSARRVKARPSDLIIGWARREG